MKFVEKFRIIRKIVHKKPPELVVLDIMFKTAMPSHDSPGVCVNYKSGQIETVEHDAIGRFGTDTFDIQD